MKGDFIEYAYSIKDNFIENAYSVKDDYARYAYLVRESFMHICETTSLSDMHPGKLKSVDDDGENRPKLFNLRMVKFGVNGMYPELVNHQINSVDNNGENHPDHLVITYKTWGIKIVCMTERQSEIVYDQFPFQTGSVEWSAKGTYMANIDHRFVFIWKCDPILEPFAFCEHKRCRLLLINFSPGENYLVTYSNGGDKHRLIQIFNTKTGELKRRFEGQLNGFAAKNSKAYWPIIRWSGGDGDKYFGLFVENLWTLYETDSFSPINLSYEHMKDLVDFSFSPTEPYIALFLSKFSESKREAWVHILQLSNSVISFGVRLPDVRNCKFYWHRSGDFLACTADGNEEDSTCTYGVVMIVWTRHPVFPFQVLELEDRRVVAFAWEPTGCRFAIISGDYMVKFYLVNTLPCDISACSMVHHVSTKANTLSWSPVGNHIVFSGFGVVKFFNVDDNRVMASKNMHTINIEWSPSGRYLATCEVGGRVRIWSAHGNLLDQIDCKAVCRELFWCPRLKKQIKDIVDGDTATKKTLKLLATRRLQQMKQTKQK
ncbi:hypothetical protein REPUB_Repub16aG0105200 [Reevesia pubescens]